MEDNLARLTGELYKRWKKAQKARLPQAHPDEEELACLAQNLLNTDEAGRIKEHILVCDDCSHALALHLKIQGAAPEDVPEELQARIKELVSGQDAALWQIVLLLKEKALEIIDVSGNILLGQELVPAPVLRSRSIKEFKDEVTILKEFKDIRVEARIVNKQGKSFSLTITAKDKQSNKTVKDLRVTLLKGELELESYLVDSGAVTFEHVLLGKYTVELYGAESGKFASVLLDIKT